MPGYLKRLAGRVAEGSTQYAGRVTPLLRGLGSLAGRSLRTAVPVARRHFPRMAGAVEAAAPRVGLAAVMVAAVLVVALMATLANALGEGTPSSAAAAIGQRGDEQASRGQERAVEAPPAPKKPEKPVKAKSGWAAPSTAEVSDTYGPRGWRDGEMHWGMDFAANMGDKIYAAYDGTVIMAQEYGGYGNCVVIRHADGVQTLYGHFSKLEVSAGDEVETGDLIGRAGATGDSTGPHLHFETTIDGSYLDPQKFLREKGVDV